MDNLWIAALNAADRKRIEPHLKQGEITRGQMLARLDEARAHGLPMTNYGMCISLAQGVLERVLSPFPEALAAWRAEAQLPG